MTIEQILYEMDRSDGNTEKMNAGPCFLNCKLHQELLAEQNKAQKELLDEQRAFQSKYLDHSKWLVIGTWILALATMPLVGATFFLAIKKPV